jgi:hypothetical protein
MRNWPSEDDEGFVGIEVVVPDEIPQQFHHLELVVVHFGDDPEASSAGRSG